MKSAGWIIFVAAAIVAVVMWQRGSYQLNEAGRQYQRQRQDMLDRQARSQEQLKSQISDTTSTLTKRQEEVESKRKEKAELEVKVKRLERQVATTTASKERMEQYLPKLGIYWNEMK